MALPEGPSNVTREGLPCSLCECLKFKDYKPMSTMSRFHSRIFHNSCKECAQIVEPSDCCTFCQHLRVRHLLICLSTWGSPTEKYACLKDLKVELGSITELQSRQHCLLCRFFYEVMTIQYRFWQATFPEEGNLIFLEFYSFGPALRILDKVQKEIRFSVRDARNYYSTPAILPSKLDWGTLHLWKRNYMAETSPRHPENISSKHTSAERNHQYFLMIDVENGCIVSKPMSCTYAALSYVWGSPKQRGLHTTLANLGELSKPGALTQENIPLTILDAMTAASELRIPYLWVDRLCIVQDDPKTKHGLINKMDFIYANALATFVAGAGKDASYGLPGVSTERSPEQAQIRIQGVELTGALPAFIEDIMPRMAWNERGWTYQEAMFSANLIFFTDYGVFYERTKSSHEILAEPPNPDATSVFSAIKDFFRSVEAYSGRTLSYESDIERAFSGVLQSYYGEEHAYGSPLRFFDAALRWNPKDGQRDQRPSSNEDIFPSWSWLSVVGRVDFSEAHFSEDSLSVATWAMAFPTATGESEFRVIGLQRYGDSEVSPPLLSKAWEADFFQERPQFFTPTWKSYEDCWIESSGFHPKSGPSRSDCPEYHHRLRPGQVLVRTKLARFHKVQKLDPRTGIISEQYTSRKVDCFDLGGLYLILQEPERVEAIALSITQRFDLIKGINDSAEFDSPTTDDMFEYSYRVNYMEIRRVDGVAYRTGLGWVSLKLWEEAKSTFETIVLG